MTGSVRATQPRVAIGPTGVSRPSGPEHQKSLKRVRKQSLGASPQDPQSPERVRPGVSKESEKSLKPFFSDSFKAFSSKRGLFFTIKGPRALPKFHTDTTPPPPPPSPSPSLLENPLLGFSVNPPRSLQWGGPGGGEVRVEFGERARPLYREKKAPFDENALLI